MIVFLMSTIAKSSLSNTVKIKKSIFVKNPAVRFTLNISTNQRFGTYAAPLDSQKMPIESRIIHVLFAGAKDAETTILKCFYYTLREIARYYCSRV